MNRLTHDPKSVRRVMQLSREEFFVFVEGIRNDTYFYSQIIESMDTKIAYQIFLAQEVGGTDGGKQKLLKLHDYLQEKNSLIDTFQGKKTAAFFYLDKDIDDIENDLRTSQHVCYTHFYDVESHIFREGDLVTSISAAASLETRIFRKVIISQSDWLLDMATTWKQWVIICLLIKKLNIKNEPNYSIVSPINQPYHKNCDETLFAKKITDIASKATLTNDAFAAILKDITELVEGYYTSGKADVIFKGKWYGHIVDHFVNEMAGSRGYNKRHFTEKLVALLAGTIDFKGIWADHFTQPLHVVINLYRTQ